MILILFFNVLFDTDEESKQKDEIKLLASSDTIAVPETGIEMPMISRSYSPIIEDPRERDSRPASVDLIERRESNFQFKEGDNMSITSRAVTPSSMIPSEAMTPSSVRSRAVSPNVELARDSSPASGSVRAITPTAKASNELNAEVKNDKPTSDSTDTLQPIFKPLVTEKGKSKTTGKSIGGWI